MLWIVSAGELQDRAGFDEKTEDRYFAAVLLLQAQLDKEAWKELDRHCKRAVAITLLDNIDQMADKSSGSVVSSQRVGDTTVSYQTNKSQIEASSKGIPLALHRLLDSLGLYQSEIRFFR